MFLIPKQEICVTSCLSPFNNVFNLEILPFIILDIWYRLLDLFQELKQPTFGSPVGRHQYFGSGVSLEVLAELIDFLLTLNILILSIINERLISYTHALDSVGLAFGHGCFTEFLTDFLFFQTVNRASFLLGLALADYDLLPLKLVFDI
jgi:hypothetical protein